MQDSARRSDMVVVLSHGIISTAPKPSLSATQTQIIWFKVFIIQSLPQTITPSLPDMQPKLWLVNYYPQLGN